MDIYQIWTTYNKKWSKYEILAFSVILLLTVIIMAYCLWKKKLNIIQAGAVVAMVIFLGIVFGSTVFTRTSTVRQYELMPLWSWRAIIRYHDWGLLKEDLLNCILLLPAGALLPVIANRKVKWYQALLFGVLISAVIETSQLVFMRGLFEWDDIIHNGLGCMVGCLVVDGGV
nr:VanZ family protein [uncultured Blautia sp.]